MAELLAQDGGSPGSGEARLLARPGHPTTSVPPGLHPLRLDRHRDAFLFVPAGYRAEQPAAFVVSLHGAGGNATSGLYPLWDLADEAGLILLSPASRGQTWDLLRGGYGPDVAFIDRALAVAFAQCVVDPARLAIAGFSDGASYALSLGITNGDLFRSVMAFSPGFMAPLEQRGGAPDLHLPWHWGSGAGDRSHQSHGSPPTGASRVRRDVPGVPGNPHRPARDRPAGTDVVPGRLTWRCDAGHDLGVSGYSKASTTATAHVAWRPRQSTGA